MLGSKIRTVVAVVGLACAAPENVFDARSLEVGPTVVSEIPGPVLRTARLRPVVAVVAENTFTEVTDFVIPYGVLSASGVADVVAVATRSGPIRMFPAGFLVEPEATIDAFDLRFPQGADYVIVPAVQRSDAPELLAWIGAQARKGATVVGVCDGVYAVANAGLLDGRDATGHWYSLDDLARRHPRTRFVKGLRYVSDRNVVTTTGVTASIPVSLALVEAIAGPERAASTARALGVSSWSPEHESEDFSLGLRDVMVAARNLLLRWRHEELGLAVREGVDEIALALASDAYSRTFRSRAHAVFDGGDRVRTLRGLVLVAEKGAAPPRLDAMLSPFASGEAAGALDRSLREIASRYGVATAAFVALQMEYPYRPPE